MYVTSNTVQDIVHFTSFEQEGLRRKTLSLPRSILEQEYPPDTYLNFQINWHHPSHIWTYWSCENIQDSIRAIRRVMADGSSGLIPYLLWLHPAMNGLPLHPLEFSVSVM